MEWRDEGIIIGGRRYGETSLIVEVMTRDHGRHPGLVKGGRSKRAQPLLQPGNAVEVTWRARLEEHLGTYAIETTRMRGTELMAAPASLHALNLLLGHLRLLAEREPHLGLYDAALQLLDVMDRPEVAPAQMVRFELALLADSGFGLDLNECAATGTREDLVYVSPKSARAVSRPAGVPYKERLLPLPAFLHTPSSDMASQAMLSQAMLSQAMLSQAVVSHADIEAGFQLTGFFLDRNLYTPRGLPLPAARDAYLATLERDACLADAKMMTL